MPFFLVRKSVVLAVFFFKTLEMYFNTTQLHYIMDICTDEWGLNSRSFYRIFWWVLQIFPLRNIFLFSCHGLHISGTTQPSKTRYDYFCNELGGQSVFDQVMNGFD